MAAITGAAGAFWGPARDVDGKIKAPVSFTDEAMVRQTDNKTYIIDDSTKRYWDKRQPVKVEVSTDAGSTWDEVTSGYSVQYAGGVIVFGTAGADREVRVSGRYYELEEKLGFFSWTLTPDVSIHEVTDFQSEGWTENIAGNRSWSAQAEQHWRNEEKMDDWVGEMLPISFYVDDRAGAKHRYEGVAHVSQDALTVPQGDIVDRTIQFTGDGGVWRREG